MGLEMKTTESLSNQLIADNFYIRVTRTLLVIKLNLLWNFYETHIVRFLQNITSIRKDAGIHRFAP